MHVAKYDLLTVMYFVGGASCSPGLNAFEMMVVCMCGSNVDSTYKRIILCCCRLLYTRVYFSSCSFVPA